MTSPSHHRMRSLLFTLALFALGSASVPARADGTAAPPSTPAPAPAPSVTEKWQDADLGPMMGRGESGYASTTLVTVAYGFIWLMVAGFVVSIWRRSARVERELEELHQQIARGDRARKTT